MTDRSIDTGSGTALSDARARAFRLLLERRGLAGARRPPIEAGPLDRPVPLSYSQRRLWLLQRIEPDNPSFVIPLVLEIVGEATVGEIDRALAAIVERHAILRTRVVEGADGEPMQRIDPIDPIDPGAGSGLGVVDLAGIGEASGGAELRRALADDLERPFDLERDLPRRFRLFRAGPDRHVLVAIFHHGVFDGWSAGVFLGELRALLAHRRGLGPAPPPPPVQFADYARWQRSWLDEEALERHLDYWREALADAPAELALPFDRPRPERPSLAGAGRSLLLGEDLADALGALARRRGTTLVTVLLAGFQALLLRWTGQLDVSSSVPFAGRDEGAVEGLIGMFANRLVIRTTADDGVGFGALVERVRERLVAAEEHAAVPFEMVVERLRPERREGRAPLAQVFVLFEMDGPGPAAAGDDLAAEDAESGALPWVRPISPGRRRVKFDLTVTFRRRDDDVAVSFDYPTELFDPTTVERMLLAYRRLVAAAVAQPERPLAELALLGPAERHLLAHEWNDSRELLDLAPLHRLVARSIARTPDAVALVAGRRHWTYRALDLRAASIAARLAALGVGPGDRVLVAAHRSPEMVAGLLAVLRRGAAYVPIDPAAPTARAEVLLEDAGIRVALVAGGTAPDWLGDRIERVAVDAPDLSAAVDAADRDDVPLEATAVVIYTSGSTGKPKGVLLSHRSLANRVLWGSRAYPLGADDMVLQKANLGFDFAIWEIFAPLAVGGRLLLAEPGGEGDVVHLARLVRREPVTFVHFVPSVLWLWLDQPGLDETRLHTVFAGAEALPRALAERFSEVVGRPAGTLLRNQYGPTEAAVDVSHEPYGVGPVRETVPIGRPISNVRLYVADAGLRLVSPGVVGELLLSGDGLADGYLGASRLTAERFVPEPWGGVVGGRAYRSGDLVRQHPDGRIEYLRRRDDQVKLRGLRIELGEVETALREALDGGEGAVAVRGGAQGDPVLVAYVVDGDAGPRVTATDELRAELARRLPRHMVPSVFVHLPALPRTATGKLDRRALPEPTAEVAASDRPPAAPRTPVEEAVVRVWREVLGIERVGVYDGFFDLGGHSLLALRATSRLEALFGVELPLAHLFEASSAAELAARIERLLQGDETAPPPPLEPVARRGALAPSFAQERLWFVDRLLVDRSAYNVPLALDLHGRLDAGALARALTAVVARHEVLRGGFHEEAGRPRVRVEPAAALPLPLVDLAALPAAARPQEARRRAEGLGRVPFDLARPPLVRVALVRLAPEHHVLVATFHHIAIDAWSRDLFYRELAALYGSADGAPPPPPPPELPVQYLDFAHWQRQALAGPRLERELDYWRQRLDGRPSQLDLPVDRARASARTHRAGRHSFAFGPALSTDLLALGRRRGATPFMTCLAGYLALLGHLTGDDDLVVGTPISGRNRVETENLLGYFLNTLPLRVTRDEGDGFADLLDRVRDAALGAYSHMEVPFELLVDELEEERSLDRSPLVQAMFVLVSQAAQDRVELPGLAWNATTTALESAKFDLTLALAERDGLLSGGFEYDADLFDGTTLERWADHLVTLLEAAVDAPETPLAELAWIPPAQRHQVLHVWGEGAPVPEPRPVSDRVVARAAEQPDAVAVSAGGARLTYGELVRRSGSLARRLAAAGLGREDRVGVLLEPSVDLVTALLGVLRAGCAYVPLDPALPDERLAALLDDAGAAAVVTVSGLAGRLPEDGRHRELLDRPETPGESTRPAALPETPIDALAYVIFTSGSTGRPKGVAVPHRGLAALVDWHLDAYTPRPGQRWGQVAGLGFDAVVWELWPALVAGATVEVADGDSRRGVERMAGWLSRHRIATCFLPTPMAEGLLAADRLPTTLGRLLTGGDRLTTFPAPMSGIELVNHYGPTEVSVVTTAGLVPPATGDTPPAALPSIGRPIGGRRARLMDAHLRPVPTGVAGEMALGGPGLARGYLGRPAQTAALFVPDPESREPGARLYRSGDLARWLADGRLEFLGRIDRQLKVRGFRIEPGEVEAALRAHPAVAEAVVDVRARGERSVFAAWIVPAGDETPDPAALVRHLGARLPDFMIPAAFVPVAALPWTANGKVDRRALPDPDPAAEAAASRPPTSAAERMVAGFWAEVLGLGAGDRVGVEDDFFAVGGHSLLATRLLFELEQVLRVEIPLRAFFERPTVSALVERLVAVYGDPAVVEEIAETYLSLDDSRDDGDEESR